MDHVRNFQPERFRLMFAPAIIITLSLLLAAIICWSDHNQALNGWIATVVYTGIVWIWIFNVAFVYLG